MPAARECIVEGGGDPLAAPCAEECAAGDEAPPKLTPLWALKAVYCVGTGSGACLWKYIIVFYHHIGLTNEQIGLIQMLNPSVNFVAQLLWAAVCDILQSYKEVLALSNAFGVATVCCCLFAYVQQHYAVLCAVILTSSAFMASRGSVNDSMTLQVVEDYKNARVLAEQRGQPVATRSLPTYGEQRLWGAAGWGFGSLFGGLLMDHFGVDFMFISFGCLLAVVVLVILTQFPSKSAQRARRAAEEGAAQRSFRSFEVLWFFANLFMYGINMALVETFLFVYLLREFHGVTSLLLGSTVFVMCVFEVPVFLYINRAFTKVDLVSLLSLCHWVFAVRCVAYSLLPRAHPALVLLVEPLHGITFACMWSCSVEYGKRLAPTGGEAKMQALVNGLYYQLAIGCGSAFWGRLTEEAPKGYGFTTCYLASAVLMVSWSVLWNLGWWVRRRRSPAAPLLSRARAASATLRLSGA